MGLSNFWFGILFFFCSPAHTNWKTQLPETGELQPLDSKMLFKPCNPVCSFHSQGNYPEWETEEKKWDIQALPPGHNICLKPTMLAEAGVISSSNKGGSDWNLSQRSVNGVYHTIWVFNSRCSFFLSWDVPRTCPEVAKSSMPSSEGPLFIQVHSHCKSYLDLSWPTSPKDQFVIILPSFSWLKSRNS